MGLQAAKMYKLYSEQEMTQTKVDVVDAVVKSYYMVLINEVRFERLKSNEERLLQLLDETKLDDLQFICNITNYRPCHNIQIKSNDISLQIRVGDFIWDYGDCYGRNTSLLRSIDLSDRVFPKWKKDLNIC